jgi:hypothetical protein
MLVFLFGGLLFELVQEPAAVLQTGELCNSTSTTLLAYWQSQALILL